GPDKTNRKNTENINWNSSFMNLYFEFLNASHTYPLLLTIHLQTDKYHQPNVSIVWILLYSDRSTPSICFLHSNGADIRVSYCCRPTKSRNRIGYPYG